MNRAELAQNLVDRVWERFDMDIDDFEDDLDHPVDAYNEPADYADILVEFASRLLDPDALDEAAARARSRIPKCENEGGGVCPKPATHTVLDPTSNSLDNGTERFCLTHVIEIASILLVEFPNQPVLVKPLKP